jgi:serine/threonine protein kinase
MGSPRRRHADAASITYNGRSSSFSDSSVGDGLQHNDDTHARKRKRKVSGDVNRVSTALSWCIMSSICRPQRKHRSQNILTAFCSCLVAFIFVEQLGYLKAFRWQGNQRISGLGADEEKSTGYNKGPRIIGLDPSENRAATVDFTQVYFPNTKQDRRERYKRIRIPYTRDKRTSIDFVIAEELERGSCKAMYPWQLTTFPSCNLLYEHSHLEWNQVARGSIRTINNGYFRDVWKLDHEAFEMGLTDLDNAQNTTPEHVVMKTLRVKQEFHAFNSDRHRRDAVAMERLTAAPHIVNIYGFCGNSQLTEYSDVGDLHDEIFSVRYEKMTPNIKLSMAHEIAQAIAEIHSYGTYGNQMPSMAHTDISPQQFLYIDGIYKLTDFNRVRFIPKNEDTGEACPYRVSNNPGLVSEKGAPQCLRS